MIEFSPTRQSLQLLKLGLLFVAIVVHVSATAQKTADAPQPKTSTEIPQDQLGRTTPRGAVLGFLTAAYSGNFRTAAAYLNTRSSETDAMILAQKLFFVLDRRLPAKLNNLSDDPQGSRLDPLDSRRELVGTIASSSGNVEIVVERVEKPKSAPIWLFSRQTLASIPDLYEELNAVAIENILPEAWLRKFLGVSWFGWFFLFVGMPGAYFVLSLLSRLFGWLIGIVVRRVGKRPEFKNPSILPIPLRLLIIAIAIRWLMTKFSVHLLGRQIGSALSAVIGITALVWVAILINGICQRYFHRRLEAQGKIGKATILRPARRLMDLLAVVVGLLLGLHAFGVNPTAALAGLGVGGIAVALAAQKTLENVIGGASLILDEAVRIGDFFKIGDVSGTVEAVGLRSTRLRTPDRTLVTIPNGQIANMTLENFTSRDCFWFRHLLGLRYETSMSEIQTVIEAIRTLLRNEPRVRPATVRVRFLKLAESSLDIEVFAYVSARDWEHYLEIQEDLLLKIKETVVGRGVQIAFPSRTVYVEASADEPGLNATGRFQRTAAGGKAS